MAQTWFDQFHQLDPLAVRVVLGVAGALLLLLILRRFASRRSARREARLRSELRERYGAIQLQRQEIERLAQRIIATSSTANIAGFEIVRQIEAVFADGQRSPAEAVDMLKALAARKGANALINLAGQRLPSGKCVGQADAVIVRPVDVSRDDGGGGAGR